ncbi:MAG: protein kinase domain-containing protein [Nitrospinota bacterium]
MVNIIQNLTDCKKLGRYEVEGELGRGAMGIVFKGKDPVLNREVALKVISSVSGPKSAKSRQQAINRFHSEASAAGRLSHPSLITVYDLGEEQFNGESLFYIAMEYLDGADLSDLIAGKLITSLERKKDIIKFAAEGLSCAHKHGIVHRDIKPSNIRETIDRTIKVTDFGLAMLPESELTVEGTLLGTPQYISPEQANGSAASPKSDLFALTVILYEMITGEKPFDGLNLLSILRNVLTKDPPLPSTLVPNLPAGVDRFISKGLSKNPLNRHKDAFDYIQDLEHVFRKEALEIHSEQSASTMQDSIPKLYSTEYTINFKEAKNRLKPLLEFYPRLAFHFNEDLLQHKSRYFFKNLGFAVEPIAAGPFDTLVEGLAKAIIGKRILILHYRTQSTISSKDDRNNIITLLRAVKEESKVDTLHNVIPVFITTQLEQQRPMFKMLAPFGIRMAAFLSPIDSVVNNITDILNVLYEYMDLLSDNSISATSNKPTKADSESIAANYDSLIDQAEADTGRCHFSSAISNYTKAIKIKPDRKLFLERGNLFFENQDYVKALQDYKKASDSEFEHPYIGAKIGACCLALSEQTLATDEEKAKKWFTVGMERLELTENKIEATIQKRLKTAPESIPNNPFKPIVSSIYKAQVNVENLNDATGRLTALLDRSIAKSEQYNHGESNDPDFLIARASFHITQGDFELAEEILLKLLKTAPELAAIELNNLAIKYRILGNSEHAFEIYKLLLNEVTPDRETILKNSLIAGLKTALKYRKSKRFKEALNIYTELLDYPVGKKESIFCELGMTQLEQDNPDGAKAAFESAIKINPSVKDPKQFLNYEPLRRL